MAEEEATQPSFDLPEFEGTTPVGVVTKVNGTGQRIHRPLGLETRIILVIEAEVTNVGHVVTEQGIKRIHTLAVRDLYEAEGKAGKKLLSQMRLAAKKADDERHGRQTLPGVDDTPNTDHGLTLDENGVALTPEELAAAQGNVASFGEETPDPVVLVFDDESRALWPDDYEVPDLENEPFAGDFIVNPNSTDGNERQIKKVLDVETGETIEEWTDEQENERLLKIEKDLEAKEAAEAAPKPKAKKKPAKAKNVIADEITPALEADAAAEGPALPGEEA